MKLLFRRVVFVPIAVNISIFDALLLETDRHNKRVQAQSQDRKKSPFQQGKPQVKNFSDKMQLAAFDVGMPGDPSFPVAESPRCSQSESEKAREKTDKHNAQILQQCSGEIRIVMMAQNTTPSFLFTYILR